MNWEKKYNLNFENTTNYLISILFFSIKIDIFCILKNIESLRALGQPERFAFPFEVPLIS